MKNKRKNPRTALFVLTACALLLLPGCNRSRRNVVQGYIEGEFVYVASPLSGTLTSLSVKKGSQVRMGQTLFELENGLETAARNQALQRLAEGRANLVDARKGKREPEIEAIEARLKQARAAFLLSSKEYERQSNLFRSGSAAAQEFDRARSTQEQDQERVLQLAADLRAANLGLRSDQIVAAEANVQALEAAVAKADWELAQKTQEAPRAGMVFDTLYRTGEWIAAGRPVVALLPPDNIKLRAFVPEEKIGGIHPGASIQVTVDGLKEIFPGRVSFISPKAEFTPPVIYSRESRAKLVYMIEAVFELAVTEKLHPGQPVDVRFGSR